MDTYILMYILYILCNCCNTIYIITEISLVLPWRFCILNYFLNIVVPMNVLLLEKCFRTALVRAAMHKALDGCCTCSYLGSTFQL